MNLSVARMVRKGDGNRVGHHLSATDERTPFVAIDVAIWTMLMVVHVVVEVFVFYSILDTNVDKCFPRNAWQDEDMPLTHYLLLLLC